MSFFLAGAGALFLVPASEQYLARPALEDAAAPAAAFPPAPRTRGGATARLRWPVAGPAADAGAEDWSTALPEPQEAAQAEESLDARDPSALPMGPAASVQPSALSPLPRPGLGRSRPSGWLQSFSQAAAAGVSAASAWSGLPRARDNWTKAGRRSLSALRRGGLRSLLKDERSAARLDTAAMRSDYTRLAPNQTATSAYDPQASPESYVVSGEFDRQAAAPDAAAPTDKPSDEKEETRTPETERPEPVKDQGQKDFDSGAASPQGSRPALTGRGGADMSGLGRKTMAQICADLRGVPFNPMAQKLMRAIGLVTVAEVNLHDQGGLLCAEGVVPQRFAKDPLGGKASSVHAILARAHGVLDGPDVLPRLGEAVRLCKQADGKAESSANSVSREASRELARAKTPCTVNRLCCDSYQRVLGVCQWAKGAPCTGAVCPQCEAPNRQARQSAVREIDAKAKDTGCAGFKRAYDDIENGFQHGRTPLRKVEESAAALNREKVGPALEAVCRGAAEAKECRFTGSGAAAGAKDQDYLHRISGMLTQARQLLDELSLTSQDTAEILKVTQDWKDWVREVQGESQRVAGVFQEQVQLVNRLSPVLPKLEKAAVRWDRAEFVVKKDAAIPDQEIAKFTEESVLKLGSGTALKPVLAERWCQNPPKVSLDCDSVDEVSAAVRDNEEKVRPVVQNAQKKQRDETSKRALDAVKKALGAAKP